MSIEVKVPVLPESVADATVLTWHKKVGDAVARDENIVDIETDKVVLEVPAAEDGVIKEILENEGSTVIANQILGVLEAGAAPAATKGQVSDTAAASESGKSVGSHANLSPSARRAAGETGADVNGMNGSGRDGRITKQDILQSSKAQPSTNSVPVVAGERTETRVPMSRLRARVAERLLGAQQETAMLSTFNEVNLQAVMDLRTRYKDKFEKTHGVKLGFMSLFTRAAVEALKRFPDVNASIDGKDIIYHGYQDVGIAVSTERGLVVPILRDVDSMSLADIELQIGDFAQRARQGQITMEEMTGGTFTITNGGVFGSLLSTPILNAPQSAILGMHKIEKRPVVENDEIVIRPMMYLALTYDHRIIDGKQSVGFLVTIKELLEDPARLLLGI